MNWQLTEPGTLRIEKGEPFCRVFPVMQGALEAVTPEVFNIEQDPALRGQHDAWRAKRDEFRARLARNDAAALKEAWQKFYFKGEHADTGLPAASHTSKLRLNDPIDSRG
jgi:hypothetical protein